MTNNIETLRALLAWAAKIIAADPVDMTPEADDFIERVEAALGPRPWPLPVDVSEDDDEGDEDPDSDDYDGSNSPDDEEK